MSDENRRSISIMSKNRIQTDEELKRRSESRRNNQEYRKTPLILQIRLCKEYIEWRNTIFNRDLYTCQKCNKNKCYVEVHHIKRFSDILKQYNIKTFDDAINCPELWNINNGKTLCEECHSKYPKYIRS